MKLLKAIFIFTFICSCSSIKDTNDGSVSIFKSDNLLKVDKGLSSVKIDIPKSKINEFWNGQYYDIDNFSFSKTVTSKKRIITGYNLKNNFIFSPIIADDKIFLLDESANLTARNLDNYNVIWKIKLSKSKDFAGGKIYYKNDIIFVTTGYNSLSAINADNGQVIWSRSIKSIPISSPVSDGKYVFFITDNNKTYALNVKDGRIKWIHSGYSRDTAILGSADPVIYKDVLISSYSSGEIYAFNKKTSEVIWSYELNSNKAISSNFILNDVDATPIIHNEVAYVVGNGGLIMAVSIGDGRILWQKEFSTIINFWVAGNFIYLINNDSQLISIYKRNGKIKWFSQLKKYDNADKLEDKIIYNGIIMAGGNLIVTNNDGEIIIISPINGDILQEYKTSGKNYHRPVIVDGKMYLHNIGIFSNNLTIVQ